MGKLFLLLFALFIGRIQAQSDYVNIMIDAVAGSHGPCEPTIAISPADPKLIVAGSVLNRVYASVDGGRKWEKSTLKSSYGVYGDPCIVGDSSGNFYYFHLADPTGEGRQGSQWLDRMVCQKSVDKGKTWSNGSFTGLNGHKQQDKEWAAIDPASQNIYLTWTEFDKYGSTDPLDSSVILFSKSDDLGDTWTRPVRLNQYAGNCLDDDGTTEGAVPAVGPDGQIYVAWSLNEKIYFDKSLDMGRTWQKQDVVVSNQPGGWDIDIPALGRANGMPVTECDLSGGPFRGNIYVNWADQRNGTDNTDIWITTSSDQGQTWSRPMKVNDDDTRSHQFFTWMSVDPVTGYIFIVFYDRRNFQDVQTDVYLAWSKDGGETFTNERISESPFSPSDKVFFGDYNHISAYNGSVRPIWTRGDSLELSVWTALIEIK